jgi:hypothetical protein
MAPVTDPLSLQARDRNEGRTLFDAEPLAFHLGEFCVENIERSYPGLFLRVLRQG